jgi:hypothetical protein
MEEKKRDGWDKADIVLKPVGGLLTALAIAYFGFTSSDVLNRRQEADTRVRLYSELMSRREQADSDLRKDMFKSIIDSFLNQKTRTVGEKVLNLELLAYNFHESLNLEPVFTHMKREIEISPLSVADKSDYTRRLNNVAREINRKQMLVLADAGKKFNATVDLDEFRKKQGGLTLEPATLKLDGIERTFTITVLEADLRKQQLRVRLEMRSAKGNGDAEEQTNDAEFWVGFFDFPMIDNTRLSHDQRCSLVVNAFDKQSVDLTLVYFPGAYASLKEKPYYQEVVQKLLNTNKLGSDRK